jgi:hypothetical protein
MQTSLLIRGSASACHSLASQARPSSRVSSRGPFLGPQVRAGTAMTLSSTNYVERWLYHLAPGAASLSLPRLNGSLCPAPPPSQACQHVQKPHRSTEACQAFQQDYAAGGGAAALAAADPCQQQLLLQPQYIVVQPQPPEEANSSTICEADLT